MPSTPSESDPQIVTNPDTPQQRRGPGLRRTVEPHPNVELHECAASDWGGTATLHLNRYFGLKWSGLASLEEQSRFTPSRPYRTCQVKVDRLSNLISANASDRLAFKIDVEGHELSVLRGMKTLLDSVDSWLGLCETTQPESIAELGMKVENTKYNDYLIHA